MDQYRAMFEGAVESLAQIDYALGIAGDGCNDLERTLYRIAELKGEAEAQALPVIDSPLQKLGSRLVDLLDGEQFENLEQYLLAAHRQMEELRGSAAGKAIARVIETDDFAAEVAWIYNPLPTGTLLYEGPNNEVRGGLQPVPLDRLVSG